MMAVVRPKVISEATADMDFHLGAFNVLAKGQVCLMEHSRADKLIRLD